LPTCARLGAANSNKSQLNPRSPYPLRKLRELMTIFPPSRHGTLPLAEAIEV
jgi:hypothetical protein